MRYEHERHSVGPLPASDMRARICYRGAGPPNTACLPGRERGLTGGRRAAKSPPSPPPSDPLHPHHPPTRPPPSLPPLPCQRHTRLTAEPTHKFPGRSHRVAVWLQRTPLSCSSYWGIRHCHVSVNECWKRLTAWGEIEWTNVLYNMHFGSGWLGWVEIFSTGVLVTGFASDSFVKLSETGRLWEPGTISHSLLTHLPGVCVCVCVCYPHLLILCSAWLVQLWFCYYTLPTDTGTRFQSHVLTSH